MMTRAAIVVALAAAFLPLAARADSPPPVAQLLVPLPGDVQPAWLLRPSVYVAVFRVPPTDSAVSIVAPPYVRDLTVVVDGPGAERRTFVATNDLPGHFLGVRLPADAAAAQRIELRATTVSEYGAPYLVVADDLAAFAFRAWSSDALFGVFVTLALVFGILALRRRRRLFAWYAAATAGQAGLLIPQLGTVQPSPEINQLLHAALQTLVFAALIGFALTFVRRVELPRRVVRLAWALVVLDGAITFGVDVLLDYWFVPISLVDLAIAALMLVPVALGVVALRRRVDGADFFTAGSALTALSYCVSLLPGSVALRDAPLAGAGLGAVLLALAIVAPPRGDRARIGSRQDVDGLTGIANRSALDAWLARDLSGRPRDNQTVVAAILVDVDRFRSFNDTYGHDAGDDALRRIAGVVGRSAARADDLVGRYADDQFLVLLYGTDLTAARRIADDLTRAIGALGISHGAVPSKRLSVSAGVASVTLERGDRMDLMRRATAALYLAKTMGRNRVVADELSSR
jgi:diguanylate cyclase (GGDEF)-like protein